MGKLVTLNISGEFDKGFVVQAEVRQDAGATKNQVTLAIAGASGKLLAHPELLEQYRHWQKLYTELDDFFPDRLKNKNKAGFTNSSDKDKAKNPAFEDCKKAANLLSETLNSWLRSPDFKPIEDLLRNNLQDSTSTRILLATENHGLRRLPWCEWKLLEDIPNAEIVLASPKFKQVKTSENLAKKEKIKILVILGDNAGTDADEAVIHELIPNAEICWLKEPQRSDLDAPLWKKQWDILFFAGHGVTKNEGSLGKIKINAQDWLSIDEIKNHLKTAINNGLKLAIFNACDGLGIAYQLAEGEDLYLPQIIVMREILPIVIAPKFLQYFLEDYTQGLSLYTSLRNSRKRLQILENDVPCVSWLPVLCQNPAEVTPRWWDLGGEIQVHPYKGLAAFTEEDKNIFFGRKQLTKSLLKTVKDNTLVAVIGASGSGKSSVVSAGLIPVWKAEATEILPHFVVKIRPGFPQSNPWENLAEEFGKILPSLTEDRIKFLELVVNLEANEQELTKILTQIVQTKVEKSACKILLVIDQFEELYTLCPSDKCQSFLSSLVYAVNHEAGWKIVLTLRADFLPQALDYEALGKILNQGGKELITAMRDEELTEAITLPVQNFEVEFSEQLINKIIQDYRKNSGHLPMLQFALEELWKQQNYGFISLESYEGLGGLTQVLGDYAENIYLRLGEEEKERLRQIMTQLVHPITQQNSGKVNRIATRKIATIEDIGKENWQLVTKLADQHLVVTDEEKGASVELIHEVLITAWERLKYWIDQDWYFRRWQERLSDNLIKWEREKKDEDLLQGGLLKEAESWLEQRGKQISEKERGYIEKSQKKRDRQRQQLISGLTAGLVTVSLLAIGAVWQWQRAERQSLINEVDSLSNLALNQFQSGEGGINALMIAMEAGQKLKQLVKEGEPLANYPTTSPFSALETITQNIREKNKFQSDTDSINKAIFTPDGKHIVSFAGDENKVIMWNLTGQKVTEWEPSDSEEIYDLAISPNGKYIATISNISSSFGGVGRKLNISDISGKELLHISLLEFFDSVKFSPDSQHIAITSNRNNEVIFFNLAGKQIKKIVTDGGGTIWSLAFTPNGEEIVIGNAVGLVQFWNLQTLQKTRELRANTDQVVKIDISPDGKKVLTLGVDITPQKTLMAGARLWELSEEKVTNLGFFPIYSNTNIIFSDVGFSPDGQQFAMVGLEFGGVKIYDALSGKIIEQLTINAASGYNLSYSPDSKIMAISGMNVINLLSNLKPNSAKLMNQQKFIELPVSYEVENNKVKNSSLIHFQYSADGQKLIIIDKLNNFLDIWNLEKPENRRIKLGKNLVKNIEINNFSSITPDGKSIIIITNESIQKFDLKGNLVSQLKANVGSSEMVLRTWLIGKYVADISYSSNGDGSQIATIGFNLDDYLSSVLFWDFSTKQVKQLKNNSAHPIVGKVVVSPNGKYLLTISSGIGKLWDSDGNLLNPLDVNTKSSSKEPEISMLAILLYPEKKEKDLFNGSGVEILEVWQNSTAMKAGLKSGDIILEIDGRKVDEFKKIWQFESLLKGKSGTPVKLKVKNRNGNIVEKIVLRENFIFDLSNWKLFIGNTAKFSPDSQYLASWDQGTQNLSLRNIKTKKLTEINHKAIIMDVYFSPNSKLIATTGADYSVTIWNFSGKLLNQIKLQQIPNALAFSPNSQQIAVLGHLNELGIWSIDGKQIAKYTVPEEGQGQIVFSPDGKYIATGGRKVLIWRLEKDLDELLATGCDWLKDYFVTRPEEKQKFKVCQDHPKSK